ncbi:SR-related and CTD-associated factor 4 [Triplophysa dalaica]|uniref:SR-related and CTD-associated factor 4 n=1 Tax=Triplophysa dalaica TaxID=1582913 RepID=UPI0024E04114|nr:SR-related and CTD-associated factor 4 [Triplophysa dalaica]
MDAVNAFNHELFSLMDSKPPISRAKMIAITKSAIKAIKLYKHVVQIVEKFIKKCKPEYKVPGLYVVDSIVRQSRHQFGADKDVFGPRFTKNIMGTFENLCLCPTEDRSKIVRVLNLWQKNGVFKIDVIQPLLDMAAGSSSSGGVDSGPDGASPPSPVREQEQSHPVVTSNSMTATVPQLQNSDAFAAVAQLIQSSQGQKLQQMLQNFQPPGKPQSPTVDNNRSQIHLQTQPMTATPSALIHQHLHHTQQQVEKKATFDTTLLDRFDYDDEPEAGDEGKKDETPSIQPNLGFPEQHLANQMQHFQQHMMGMSQHQQVVLPSNGQVQGFGLMNSQPFPGIMPPMGQPHTVFHPQNDTFNQIMAGHQHQERPTNSDATASHFPDDKRSRSRSGSRSPKRRRSRSNSRGRRMRHRRSRSRERRRQSPHSRSQERRERDRERERRQKGLPAVKNNTLSVCSTTLWVGQLDKRTQQQDVACLLEEFGQIDSINMIPPRGCAYIVMIHRQDAYRALQKLSRGPNKLNQKAIKIAWALNKGIKTEFKQHWDVELGVTYIPWSKIKQEDLDVFKEGGMLDTDSLPPEWRDSQSELEKAEESQNGRPEVRKMDETPPVVPMQNQVPPVQPIGAVGVPPPGFPGPMNMPPPSFPPGVPPPPGPFIRPGFNPMQMPPGFLPPGAMPPLGAAGPHPPSAGIKMPPVAGSVEDRSSDPARINNDGTDGFNSGNQVPPGGPPGMGMQSPPGLLGSRPGMMPLQRPPGMPPPHMQRFSIPPPRPGMPPMPPQMMPPRGPPQMMHREPPPRGFGMPPHPHGIRGHFPPPGPPFMRPGGPRPDGPNDHEGRPFRGEPSGLGRGRDREQDWFGGHRPFGEGHGGERSEGRERFGGWHEEPEKQGGWERERERRDWRRSPEGERDREKDGGEERSRRSGREPATRERSTRWDKDDRLDRMGNIGEEPSEKLQEPMNIDEPNANSAEELPEALPDSKASEPIGDNKSVEQTHTEES